MRYSVPLHKSSPAHAEPSNEFGLLHLQQDTETRQYPTCPRISIIDPIGSLAFAAIVLIPLNGHLRLTNYLEEFPA